MKIHVRVKIVLTTYENVYFLRVGIFWGNANHWLRNI